MIKKISKYIKFIICSTLIVGLISSIYATTVDDFAFVTKEEVDKAFSNFDGRLSSFEASINARIDQQVTTYLSRNGIWNKKNIIFKTGSSSYSIKSGIESKITSFDTNGNYLLTETDWDWAPINKGGLSSWVIKQTETGSRTLYQQANNDAPWNTYTWYLNFDVYDKDEHFLRTGSTIVLRGNTPQYFYTNNNYQILFIGYSPIIFTVYFFVSKNEFVKFSEHWDVIGYFDWSGSRLAWAEKGNVPEYSFYDCGVY